MKKRILTIVLALCMLLTMLPASASVAATPNQKLAFRTGPNTKYVELYMLPQSTSISAIEYESGNGVTWVLVEFTHEGQLVRAYTGLKRMTVHGSIPWASHANTSLTVSSEGQVYAAPSSYAAYRGRVGAGEKVTLLRYEGDYAYIEFYDASNRAPSRGYVPTWNVSGGYNPPSYNPPSYNPPSYSYPSNGGVPAALNQKMALRTGPNTKYAEMYTLPQSTTIRALEYEEGNGVTWVLVEFFHEGQRVRGYTGLKRMTVYGSIPWGSGGLGAGMSVTGCQVYAAPSADAAVRTYMDRYTHVVFLGFEGGYAYVEFTDCHTGELTRGYVYSSDVMYY